MTAPSAIVVADSVSPQGKRLTSFQITAHRFILAEINTHRMLSRSYRSSRAVPSKRLIEEVRTAPAMPVFWGKNQPGMQAREEVEGRFDCLNGWWNSYCHTEGATIQEAWVEAAGVAADIAEALAVAGLHKQIANRVLEPFLWVHGVITATEWDNFFGLRLHEDAQPEFRALANAMWAAMKASTPNPLVSGQWHLPYVNVGKGYGDNSDASDSAACMHWCDEHEPEGEADEDAWLDVLIKQSVARCARSSYKSFETGNPSTIEEDLETVRKLNIPGTEHYDPSRPIHASPAEHQATPDEIESYDIEVPVELTDEQKARREMPISIEFKMKNPSQWGNFVGFRQYRKMLPGEAVASLPEAYRNKETAS